MKFKVNEDACIGCGACEAICDEVFKISDEGYAVAKEEKITDNKVKEKAISALEGCPTDAISEDKEEKTTDNEVKEKAASALEGYPIDAISEDKEETN